MDDVIIACDRIEVRSMIEYCDGQLPRRKTVWVPRPVGKGRWKKGEAQQDFEKGSQNVSKVVSVAHL